jgi:predicted outer membrane protein
MKRVLLVLGVAAVALSMVVPSMMSAAANTGHHGRSGDDFNRWDEAYLEGATEGAIFEVSGGSLAISNARSDRVAWFGMQMIQDHSLEYRDVAQTGATVLCDTGSGALGRPCTDTDSTSSYRHLKVTLPWKPAPVMVKLLKHWEHLRGHTFDCTYITDEVSDHIEDIEEATREIHRGANPAVISLARKYLPILEQHLSWAKRIADQLGC